MVDVIAYKPSPYGRLCLHMINPSGYALGFIIYHIKHEWVYVSYIIPGKRRTYSLDLEILISLAVASKYTKIDAHAHTP